MIPAPASAPFADRLTRAPIALDPAAGAEAWRELALHDPTLRPLVEGAASGAPHLAALLRRERDWIAEALLRAPETAFAELIASVQAAADLPIAERGPALRRAKGRAALLIALADLGGVWDLEQVTGALSGLADAAVEAALRPLIAEEIARGRIDGDPASPWKSSGFVAFAMGKGGARELNYSSDIDLIFLFDEARHGDRAGEVRARLVHACRAAAQLLSKPAADGYVFRVDLRLRPDPSVTPICTSMEAAERYYESLGRTWERAAWIKARPCAGDVEAGQDFLKRLNPFVWRRHLDFAAVRDAHDIRERIREHRGVDAAAARNIKLGCGGIREIEFFVQTRQLICGGRDPDLRDRRTRVALAALAAKNWVEPEAAATLDAAYVAHRELEHRLQMVDDRQTHDVPASDTARRVIAALSGKPDLAAFDAALEARRNAVARIAEPFFQPSRPSRPSAPEPAQDRSDAAEAALSRWRSGEIPATRTARAREILGRLEGRILDALSAAAAPDEALRAFDRFLSGLPAGVQILSLFEANPRLLDLVAEICAAAPRLADHLARNPAVFDALLATEFFEPLPGAEAQRKDLRAWLSREDDYEKKLDAVRRWAKEQWFRQGVQTLRGLDAAPAAAPDAAPDAAQGFTATAEACLRALLPEVEAEFARRHGPPPGRGAAVLAMGKLGSREMTAASDLDLIVLYDAQGAEASDGPRPLPPPTWFARFAQALVSAVTAATAEGPLYRIDMRLRPSGRQGTVATSLSGFKAYQAEQAWTWERLALTRARAVAGRADLIADVDAAVAAALRRRAAPAAVLADIAEMRARVAEARRAERADPWEFKHAAGGLMDIEFALQGRLLVALAQGWSVPAGLLPGVDARRAAAALAEAGRLTRAAAARLSEAHALQARLQRIARVAMDGRVDPTTAGRGLMNALCAAADVPDAEALEARLSALQAAAAAEVDALLAAPPDAASAGAPGASSVPGPGPTPVPDPRETTGR
ncbi:MAG: bifunctional [glutamate--ammonia ligase]-adenylyl-L-tyrosine phosphorylase/[glutamate--ammonia-ligase] adenylyltransferase [Pseudomonadota bacterium]